MITQNISKTLDEKLLDISEHEVKDKKEMFQYMAEILHRASCIEETEEFISALYEREEMGSTYIGDGIAIPHGKSRAVHHAAIAICRFKPFLYISSEDCEMVELAVMLAIPSQMKSDDYMELLTGIMRIFMDDEFVGVLRTSSDKMEILDAAAKAVQKLEKF